MSYKLVIGPEYITSAPVDKLVDEESGEEQLVSLETRSDWGKWVNEVIVGYNARQELDFLREMPNVERVEIRTPTIVDLNGLTTLQRLRVLAIYRPTCRMETLGNLSSLEDLYLDGWRPGAESVFGLLNLRKLGIQRFPFPDLDGMSAFRRLEELWLNAGRLESLWGIPHSIRSLRITSNRKLSSLLPLQGCGNLVDLRLESVRQVSSLVGVEPCPLVILVLIGIGLLADLQPLTGKTTMEFLTLSEGTLDASSDIEALYSLVQLRNLFIPRKASLDIQRLRRAAPSINVRTIGFA